MSEKTKTIVMWLGLAVVAYFIYQYFRRQQLIDAQRMGAGGSAYPPGGAGGGGFNPYTLPPAPAAAPQPQQQGTDWAAFAGNLTTGLLGFGGALVNKYGGTTSSSSSGSTDDPYYGQYDGYDSGSGGDQLINPYE